MTLVSHVHKLIFLKTRKTAGTSFEMLLEPFATPPDHEVIHHTTGHVSQYGIVGVRVPLNMIHQLQGEGRMPHTMVTDADGSERPIEWFSHMPAARVRRAVGHDAWREYVHITAVRNPFARAISLFFHLMRVNDLDKSLDLSDLRSAFHDFVLSDKFLTDYEIVHINDQPVFHDAFRLEHRDADIDRIGRRLGLPLNQQKLRHTKKRPKQPSAISDAELFDPTVIEAIRRKSAWVFDNFEYSPNIEDAPL